MNLNLDSVVMKGDILLYVAGLVGIVFVLGVLWHIYRIKSIKDALRSANDGERHLVANDRRLLARILGLAQRIDVKASVTISGNQKLIDGAIAVAADLEESHTRADAVDPKTSSAGMAADAAARGS